MKALTVKQPYAAYIADGHKTIEYRSWKTDYRGPLLITASGTPAKYRETLDDGSIITLPTGCAVCIVDLVDITGTSGDYEWHLQNPRPVEAVPVKGKLNIWDYQGVINYLPAGMDWLDWRA